MGPIDKNLVLTPIFCSTQGWRLRNGTIRPEFSTARNSWREQGKKIHGSST
ncbi:MAG TPA: hypothetical protein PKZ65_05985 [Methanoregulaceae archaeon]|nr:hypothetical protein [Methanoregulaceae archaeon]